MISASGRRDIDATGLLVTTPIGLGDGGAHYGIICDADFPTRMLTHEVRGRPPRR